MTGRPRSDSRLTVVPSPRGRSKLAAVSPICSTGSTPQLERVAGVALVALAAG